MLLVLLLAGCASRPDDGERRMPDDGVIAGGWVSVQQGDTLGQIARRADIPLERLQRFNPGIDPRRLAVGQKLLVPTRRERAPSGGPYRYQIRPGDTFSSIARRFGSDPGSVQAANADTPANTLSVGHLIRVPLRGDGKPAQASTATQKADPDKTRAQVSADRSPRSTPHAGDLPGSARGWSWPLDDYRVVRRFGTDERGTLQPMLLATRDGDRARAVADGEVRFADSMRQLGQVVIVHHPDNVQSVYALCKTPLVTAGDRVSRGDELCEVSFSNTTERHDLLFDLRHGGKPVDPRQALR
jgi:lipoprotein NlpD